MRKAGALRTFDVAGVQGMRGKRYRWRPGRGMADL